jgi:hyaluronate lyase
VSSDEGIRVTRVPGGTLLQFNTRHAYGRSLSVTLVG